MVATLTNEQELPLVHRTIDGSNQEELLTQYLRDIFE